MAMKDTFKTYGTYAYFGVFFLILFFDHKHIDLVRAPFILFILVQAARGKLSLKFFVDPVFIGTALFAATAMISNFLNRVPQHEIVQILNWLFPYGLGKYAIMKSKEIDTEVILLLLLGCAAIFAGIGIVGYGLDLQTLFGIELFEWYGKEARYAFTMSGTNRAGFCIGVALILNAYFFIKNGFRLTRKNVWVTICFPIVFAALFLIKERKTLLMVCAVLVVLLALYRKYKILIPMAIAAGIILAVCPLPQRYNVREMFVDEGMQGRFNAWECALGLFGESPVFGHGYPSFKKASAAYYERNKDRFRFKVFNHYGIAHNLNLNALAETGILGFIALNTIFFSAWRFFKYRHEAPLVFVFGAAILFIYVTMQFGNFVHSATRTDMAFLVMGIYAALEWKIRHKGPVKKTANA